MKRIGRKLVMICLVMLALCVSAGAVGSAFDRLDFIRREGFTTEIVDVYGEVYTYDGVLNVSTLEEHDCVEEVASYAILFAGEEVLTAQLHDIYAVPEGQSAGAAAATNGYYSVTFYIGDSSEKEVFMTGLTPENQKKVQDANIAAVLNGTSVSLDDLAFIDAEKQYDIWDEENDIVVDSDQELCWAAAASNVLHYTGWGKQAGFGSADYLLDLFTACFEDGGSRTEYAFEWFLNGHYAAQTWDGWPMVDAAGEFQYGTFPGFFPEYCSTDLIECVDVGNTPWNIGRVMTGLREGCGVSIALGWYNSSGVRDGGHAITLWGYVKDISKDPVTDKDAYCALIISDSDNDVTWGSDRRGAPNTLQVEPIQSVSLADLDTWWLSDYGDGYLEDFTILKPWSGDLPKDGSVQAGKTPSVFSSYDIAITQMRTGVCGMLADVFAQDQVIDLVPYLAIRGNTGYTGPLEVTLTVKDRGGAVREQYTVPMQGPYSAGQSFSFSIAMETPLAPGTYTVTASISGMTEDAYENNNTASHTFTVSDRSEHINTLSINRASMVKAGNYGVFGTLTLEYGEDNLGFEPQQYELDITYNGGKTWEAVYIGKERPTKIEQLHLDPDMVNSTYVSLFMQTLDTSGYSGLLTDEFKVSVEDYYALAVDTKEHALTIGQGDTSFRPGDQLQFIVEDCGSLPMQYQYHMYLTAFSLETKKEVALLDGFYDPTRAVYDFYGFDAMKDLPAGEYYLYADFWYDPVVDGRYQSYSYEWLGTLTVLPNAFSVSSGEPDVGSAEMDVPYTLQAPAGSNFKLRVYYGASPDRLNSYSGYPYPDFEGGQKSGWITLETEPNTTYYYQVRLLQNEEVVASTDKMGPFTTGSCPTINAEETVTFTLERGERAVYALTAPEAGAYTISAKGPMGWLRVRDGSWPEKEISFNGLSDSMQVWLEQNQRIYLFVTAEMGGSFTLSTKAEGIGTTTLLTPEKTALTLKSGGSVSCCTYTALDTNGTVTLTVSGADGYVRYYDDARGAFVTRKFTLNGTEVALPVTAGSAASFQVYAYEGGEYTLSYTSDVTLYSRTADGVGFLMGQSDSAVTLAALYRDDGKMLDVKAVTAGSGLRLQGGEGARVDFLTLSDSYLPEADVKELALASLQMEPS